MVARTDGPFEYWEVTGDAVRAAGEKPGSDAAVIQSLAGELEGDEKNAAAAIEGDIEAGVKANTTAAKDTAAALASKGTYAVGLLNQFAKDVDEFDSTVNQINLDYNNQVQTNISTARTQASQDAKDGEEPAAVDTGAIASAVKASFLPRYQKAEGIIDDAADLVASMFKSGPTDANVKDLILAGLIPFGAADLFPSVRDSLTAEEKQQALANTIKGMTPEQQAKYVQDHKDIDAKTASVISPEAQTILADDVAADVKDQKVDAETVRILSLLQDQHPFAHAFYSQVSPDQMSEAIQKLSSDTYPNGPFNSGSRGPVDPLDQGKVDLYKNFLSAAGGTLATYSTGTGLYEPPAEAGITWGKAIIDEDHPQNAGALSLLLREGGEKHEFDGQFLSDVGDTVYKYEQEHKDDRPWDSRGSLVIDPDARIGNLDDKGWGVRSFDAMSNVLGAMKSSPDAAQMFFADGYPDENHDGHPDMAGKNSRLEYLLTERSFSKDLADWKSGDEGDGLGLALEAATIGNMDTKTSAPGLDIPHDEFGATLATQSLKMIADHVKADDGWHTWPGMRDSLGAIVGAHINDVFDIAQTDGRTTENGQFYPHGGGLPAGLNLSNADLASVISEIGRGDDKTGLEIMVTSAVNYNNQLTSDYLSDYRADFEKNHPGEALPLTIDDLQKSGILNHLEDQSSTSGRALNYIFSNGLEGGLDDKAEQEQRAAMLKKALDIGTKFIPTPPGGKVIEVLTGQGIDWIKGQLTEVPGVKQPEEANTAMTKDMKNSLEYGTYNALIQNGYLDREHDPRYGIPPSALDPQNPSRIDPALYNGKVGDVNRPGDGVNDDGKRYTAEEAFNLWMSGAHPDERSSDEYNNAPSSIFQDFLNSYAGAAYGEEPK